MFLAEGYLHILGVRGSRGEGLTFCRSTEHHTAHFRLTWREKFSLNLNELDKVAFAKEWQGGFTGSASGQKWVGMLDK